MRAGEGLIVVLRSSVSSPSTLRRFSRCSTVAVARSLASMGLHRFSLLGRQRSSSGIWRIDEKSIEQAVIALASVWLIPEATSPKTHVRREGLEKDAHPSGKCRGCIRGAASNGDRGHQRATSELPRADFTRCSLTFLRSSTPSGYVRRTQTMPLLSLSRRRSRVRVSSAPPNLMSEGVRPSDLNPSSLILNPES